MGWTVSLRHKILAAKKMKGYVKLTFTHHPTVDDHWIAGADGNASAVREVLLIVKDKVEVELQKIKTEMEDKLQKVKTEMENEMKKFKFPL